MSTAVVGGGAPAVESKQHAWARLLTPSLADCLFASLVVWLFMVNPDGWSRLLLDGDTGWHIRAGEYILDHGSVPRTDLFSFSKQGAPWYAWEWGTDVSYALLHRAAGLKAIALAGGALIALYATLLFRYTIWRGASALPSLGITLMAVSASSLHYLARPHLATLVLVPASMWIIERDRRRQDNWVWALVPVTIVWTNLHGGFLALIACLGLLAAGTALQTLVETGWAIPAWHDFRSGRWMSFRRYGLLTAACAAASVVNPYGIELHRHIGAYLNSNFIRDTIQEFQSPKFRNENILQFEAILLVAVMLGWRMILRRRFPELLWILFWAHQALGSVRHVTVFVSIAAPLVASELSELWADWVRPASRKSVRKILDGLSNDLGYGFGWSSLWPVAFLLAVAMFDTRSKWPEDFPKERFPVAMIQRNLERIGSARILTADQWADYLIYRNYPKQRVFFDGRSDFYGPELGKEYIRVSGGQYDWRQILDRHEFNLALIPMDWALGSLLKQDKRWKLLEDDGKALLFERVEGTPITKPGSSPKKNSPHPNGNAGLIRIFSGRPHDSD